MIKDVQIFEKKVTDHKMRVLISSPTFVWSISRSKKKRAGCDKKKRTFVSIQYSNMLYRSVA